MTISKDEAQQCQDALISLANNTAMENEGPVKLTNDPFTRKRIIEALAWRAMAIAAGYSDKLVPLKFARKANSGDDNVTSPL